MLPTFRWVFPPQLNPSRNAFIGMPRCLSSRWLPMLSTWCSKLTTTSQEKTPSTYAQGCCRSTWATEYLLCLKFLPLLNGKCLYRYSSSAYHFTYSMWVETYSVHIYTLHILPDHKVRHFHLIRRLWLNNRSWLQWLYRTLDFSGRECVFYVWQEDKFTNSLFQDFNFLNDSRIRQKLGPYIRGCQVYES